MKFTINTLKEEIIMNHNSQAISAFMGSSVLSHSKDEINPFCGS